MLAGADDYTSCPDCGTSVDLTSLAEALHRCDGRHRNEHALTIALAEVELFELELCDFLDSPQGRFEVYYAARSRRLH